jgi:hypothetical protein
MYFTKEVAAEDISGLPNGPSAILFPQNCLYFDEKGNQIPSYQLLNHQGLHPYLEKYPTAKVYWGIWNKDLSLMKDESVRLFLEELKKPKLSLYRRSIASLDRLCPRFLKKFS